MDKELLEMFSLIQGVVTFIMMIAFFIMSSNIGKIKKLLNNEVEEDYYDKLGDKEVFKGNTQKASDYYHEAIFTALETKTDRYYYETNYKYAKKIANRITAAGGTLSPKLVDYIAEKSLKYDK